MPVPVPPKYHIPAHPVVKQQKLVAGEAQAAQTTNRLTSLDSALQGKQDFIPISFQHGLTVAAESASVCKWGLAKACPPPVSDESHPLILPHSNIRSNLGYTGGERAQLLQLHHRPPSGHFAEGGNVIDQPVPTEKMTANSQGVRSVSGVVPPTSLHHRPEQQTVIPGMEQARQCYAQGLGECGPVSSAKAVGNTTCYDANTPFAEYVDKAMQSLTIIADSPTATRAKAEDGGAFIQGENTVNGPGPDQDQDGDVIAAHEPLMTASTIHAYRKMAEPLSDWISGYVWKVFTTGMGLPPRYVGDRSSCYTSKQMPLRPTKVNPQLSQQIHSLLCSTLLQPSGIVLALWYITRMPILFDWHVADPSSHGPEIKFREELFGEWSPGQNKALTADARAEYEMKAPFRLVLLGCMLANKWLDDHTFSNKTWHSLTEIPIRSINLLELHALTILAHDLSIPPPAWDQWLSHIRSYQASLLPYPSPIGRPSTVNDSPHSVVKRMIDSLVCTQDAAEGKQPIFVGLKQRVEKRIKEREMTDMVDHLEIDLDADGPLRDEYLPRRRSSNGSTLSRSSESSTSSIAKAKLDMNVDVKRSSSLSMKKLVIPEYPNGGRYVGVPLPPTTVLPPPSKWSPEADPPIERQRDKVRGRYYAVQAASVPTSFDPFGVPPPPYQPYPHPPAAYALPPMPGFTPTVTVNVEVGVAPVSASEPATPYGPTASSFCQVLPFGAPNTAAAAAFTQRAPAPTYYGFYPPPPPQQQQQQLPSHHTRAHSLAVPSNHPPHLHVPHSLNTVYSHSRSVSQPFVDGIPASAAAVGHPGVANGAPADLSQVIYGIGNLVVGHQPAPPNPPAFDDVAYAHFPRWVQA